MRKILTIDKINNLFDCKIEINDLISHPLFMFKQVFIELTIIMGIYKKMGEKNKKFIKLSLNTAGWSKGFCWKNEGLI